MKHIKLFESMTELEVAKICEKYGIENWSINRDGLVDVDGDVILIYRSLTRLSLKFGVVSGNFNCRSNNLTTLEGAPNEVGGHFNCSSNNLTTLEGGPTEVNGHFSCHGNKLISLEGAPQEVSGDFLCYNNYLTTLKGGPNEVGGKFICYYNNLTTLIGAPVYIGGEVDLLNEHLPIELNKFLGFNDYRSDIQKYILKWQKDYAVWRKDGSFNQANFIQMMEAAQDELQNLKFPK